MNLFPQFKTPRKLNVYDAGGDSNETRLLLTTLQGIVNRNDPRVYLLFNLWPEDLKAEDKWLDQYSARGIKIDRVKTASELVAMFAGELSGFIVYDPDLIDTANIATMMAGQDDAVVAHPDLAPLLEKAGLKMKHDLRGRWKDKYAAYRWALDRLWDGCNHRILGSMHPPTSELYGIEVRDYLVASRAFVFNLTPDNDEEKPVAIGLFDEITSRAEEQSTVMGWVTTFPTESQYVTEISQRGHHVLCTTMCPNLTVHAGVSAERPYRVKESAKTSPKSGKKIYVSLRMSDGDSPAIMLKWHTGHWLDRLRGSIPMGWEIQPLMMELAPAVTEYYFETATDNDCLICGLSGAGYCYPSYMPDRKIFFERTKAMMDQCGLRLVQTADNDVDADGEETERFFYNEAAAGEYLQATGIDGIFACGDGKILLLGDQVVVPTPLVWADCGKIRKYLEEAACDEARPRFFSFLLSCYLVNMEEVKALIDSLPSDTYEFVRPDELISLINKAIKEDVFTDYRRIDGISRTPNT